MPRLRLLQSYHDTHFVPAYACTADSVFRLYTDNEGSGLFLGIRYHNNGTNYFVLERTMPDRMNSPITALPKPYLRLRQLPSMRKLLLLGKKIP